MTEGKLSANGASDFDGLPLDPSDDALIYAKQGFSLNGAFVLPVQRDLAGNPIYSNGRQLLVTNALTVSTGYTSSSANPNFYANLVPPQVVPVQTIIIPTFADLRQQELTRRVPTGTPNVTFNALLNPTTTLAQWNQRFPSGGTAAQPTVVQVTGGNLNIPAGVTLSNAVITLASGNITVTGTGQNFNNVLLITSNGSISLNNIQANNFSALASDALTMNGAARFSGVSLLANGSATSGITFNGATKAIDINNNLRVVAQGDITYNGATNTRGTFLTAKEFRFNGATQLFGSIKAKGNITFNGASTVFSASITIPEATPPVITARLTRDTAPSNTTNIDKITFDGAITGTVTDTSSIGEFNARFSRIPAANYVSILVDRQSNGTFTLSRARLDQVYGSTLPDGIHTLQLQAKDQFGNTSTIDFTFTLDTTTPSPVLSLPAASDSGTSSSDRITNVITPQITGTAEPGSTVEIRNDNQVIGQATTSANGTWQFTTPALVDGVRQLTATSTDIAGNVSPVSSALMVTVDSAVPHLMVTTPLNQVLTTGARLIGTTNGTGSAIATSTYRFDNAAEIPIALDLAGRFDQPFSFANVNQGNHVLTVKLVDVAGNVTTTTHAVAVVFDNDPPAITVALVNDTASGGVNNDRVTSDPRLAGTVLDASQVVGFRAKFGNQSAYNMTDVLADRQANGNFSFSPARLEQIYGGNLPDGVHTLTLQATDAYNNSSTTTFTFTLDTTPPLATLDLTIGSDSSPLGDQKTTEAIVNLVGQTEPNAIVNLQPINVTVNATALGEFTFLNVPLTLGINAFTVQTTDVAGNQSLFTRTIERLLNDTEPPVITPSLVRDTAPNSTTNIDSITSNPNIQGTVADASEVTEFWGRFNTLSSLPVTNLIGDLGTDGRFTLTRARLEQIYGGVLPDGLHTLQFQAKDEFGNVSAVFDFSFALDTILSPVPVFDLSVDSDSGVMGDRKTAFDTVTLVGQTEANATVKLEQTGTIITADNTGRFEFNNVALALGGNQFTTRAHDVAGNESTSTTTIIRLSPPITLALDNNTVPENSLGSTVIGQLISTDPDMGDAHTYTLVDDAQGRFKVMGDRLYVVEGAILDFETVNTYEVEVRSTDTSGLSKNQRLAIGITNVNEVPSFTSIPVWSIQEGTPYRYDITTTDPDSGDTRSITASNLPAGFTLVDNGDGTATLQGNPVFGAYNVSLTVQDGAGLKSIQPFVLAVNSSSPLVEGTNFVAKRSLSLTIPNTPTILSFKVAPQFDLADSDSINDALEVSLVDAAGRSLVPTTMKERDMFFNLTEGENTLLGGGATFDAATGMVRVSLVGVAPIANAQLIFRLVNNDSDVTSQVVIRDLSIAAAPVGTPAAIQTQIETIVQTNAPIDFSKLRDVTPSFVPEYHRTSFNQETDLLFADVALKNIGSYSTNAPVLIGVTHISDPSVVLRGADGVTPDGIPYYDVTTLVSAGSLDPSEETGQRSLIFYNPNQVQFTYDLVVLSNLNQGPQIKTKPVVEVIQGQVYQYDVDAIDPNQDPLTYTLLEAPDGMTIDSQTGVIAWTGTTGLGNYRVSVEVSDGRGGVAAQQFVVAVIEAPLNRPPVFTTSPVVDAYINKPYQYDADAIDPDRDPLSYSVITGPNNLGINSNTGVVNWTPPPTLILGDTVFGKASVPGENDEYLFSGTKGQRLYFDPLQYSGNHYDWNFKIVSPSGRTIVSSDFRQDQNQLITLDENGNYKVIVDAQGDRTGNYGFSVIDTSLLSLTPLDKPITDKLKLGSQDHVFRFAGSKGQRLFFDRLSLAGDLGWVLYSPSNEVVFSEYYFGDTEKELPTDGEYILALQGRSELLSSVNYSFNIITPDTILSSLSIGTNATPNVVSNTISEKGEQDIYAFTGAIGQRLYFDLLSTHPSRIRSIRTGKKLSRHP
jgi:Bacterial Ig-like domain/Putative Ig domain